MELEQKKRFQLKVILHKEEFCAETIQEMKEYTSTKAETISRWVENICLQLSF